MKSDWIKSHKKEVILLIGISLLLFAVMLIQTRIENGRYVMENGTVMAVKRSNLEKAEEIPLTLEINLAGERKAFDVVLSLDGTVKDTDHGSDKENAEDVENMQTEAIAELIKELESVNDVMISLPSKLEDGSRITWKRQSSNNWLLAFCVLPLGLLFLYRSEQVKKREIMEREKAQIQSALPTFNHQLLLLMNTGMIFHDAFFRIVSTYAQEEKRDAFGNLLLEMKRELDDGGASIVSVMEQAARKIGVRDFSRLTNIIADNQYKGVNLSEKLQSESVRLWEERKKRAAEKGKAAETKMTFPLSLLLVVLILITGAPAMMNL